MTSINTIRSAIVSLESETEQARNAAQDAERAVIDAQRSVGDSGGALDALTALREAESARDIAALVLTSKERKLSELRTKLAELESSATRNELRHFARLATRANVFGRLREVIGPLAAADPELSADDASVAELAIARHHARQQVQQILDAHVVAIAEVNRITGHLSEFAPDFEVVTLDCAKIFVEVERIALALPSKRYEAEARLRQAFFEPRLSSGLEYVRKRFSANCGYSQQRTSADELADARCALIGPLPKCVKAPQLEAALLAA